MTPDDVSRRQLLKLGSSSVAGVVAGCSGAPGGDPQQTAATNTPSSTPSWLHTTVTCEQNDSQTGVTRSKTILGVESGTRDISNSAAVLPYTTLSTRAQMIVDHALDRGTAATCESAPPDPFRNLSNAIRDEMFVDGEKAPVLYIQKGGRYYEVSYRSGDQVFYE
jgi:hypothetical protein